jgi:hypothetical protein
MRTERLMLIVVVVVVGGGGGGVVAKVESNIAIRRRSFTPLYSRCAKGRKARLVGVFSKDF